MKQILRLNKLHTINQFISMYGYSEGLNTSEIIENLDRITVYNNFLSKEIDISVIDSNDDSITDCRLGFLFYGKLIKTFRDLSELSNGEVKLKDISLYRSKDYVQ